MNTINNLLEKIKNAPALDFGSIFSESIELFKKTWIQGLLLQIFTIIVMMPLIIILYLPLVGLMIAEGNNVYNDPEVYSEFFTGMSVIYIIFVIIGILVLGAVALALKAAFFRIIKKLDLNETVETSDFFYFLKSQHLTKAFLLMLASIIVSVLFAFAAVLLAIPTFFLSFLIFLYIIVPLSYFAVMFAFNEELHVGDLVNASFKIGHKKWLLSLGLIIIASLLAQIVGMLLCFVGAIITAPFVYHPIYLIYKQVVGFDEENYIE